jgi:hypothetical protein
MRSSSTLPQHRLERNADVHPERPLSGTTVTVHPRTTAERPAGWIPRQSDIHDQLTAFRPTHLRAPVRPPVTHPPTPIAPARSFASFHNVVRLNLAELCVHIQRRLPPHPRHGRPRGVRRRRSLLPAAGSRRIEMSGMVRPQRRHRPRGPVVTRIGWARATVVGCRRLRVRRRVRRRRGARHHVPGPTARPRSGDDGHSRRRGGRGGSGKSRWRLGVTSRPRFARPSRPTRTCWRRSPGISSARRGRAPSRPLVVRVTDGLAIDCRRHVTWAAVAGGTLATRPP